MIKLVLHKVFFRQIISYLSCTKRMFLLHPKPNFSHYFCVHLSVQWVFTAYVILEIIIRHFGLWVTLSLSEWSASKQRVQSVCNWYEDRTWICLRAISFSKSKIDRGFYQTGRHKVNVQLHCQKTVCLTSRL